MKLAVGTLLLAGCFTQLTGGATVARGTVTGGAAELAVGEPAARVTLAPSVQHYDDDTGGHTTLRLDEGVRVSLMGAIYGDRDPDWINWVDIGGDAGVGFGTLPAHTFAAAYAGGFADIRLWPMHDHYPTLRVQVHDVAFSTGVANQTELFVGLGWTGRNPQGGFMPFNFD